MTARPRHLAHTSPPPSERGSGGAKEAPVSPQLLSGGRAWAQRDGSRLSWDERTRAIAERQRGRVSRRQLLAAGLDRHAVARRVRSGRLIRLPGGVFAMGHLAETELGAETAALLAVPGAALSHFSAVRLWGVLPSDAGDGLVHILAPLSARHRLEGVRIHRSRQIAPGDFRVRRGLPVVTPARALLDIAEAISARGLELAFDRALVGGIVRTDDVIRLLDRMRGRAGAARLRALAEGIRHSTLTRSEAEERFLGLIRRAGLPEPEVNARMSGYEVDFLWRAERLVVEVDGFRFHSTRRAFEHDHRKDADLRAAGLGVLRFTFDQIRSEPYAVIADVARGLPV